MSALPRPDIPPGPLRDLNHALHDLHHRAGWPSLRTLARQVTASPTTVSKVFTTPAVPTWGTLELLVEALGGDPAHFHDLWLAASAPPDAPAPRRIAGRKSELAAVRRHLQTGTGLLLVTGEAGIGKTTLVEAAAADSDTFVATGHCLPLSTEVPFLPVADALRSIHQQDAGAWLDQAIAACPPYVGGALAALLPELADGTVPASRIDDRQVLLSALAATLGALGAVRPLAVVLEDLHWADPATHDALDYLLARPVAVPVLGTWRTGDRATPSSTADWFDRVRRLSRTTVLELGPLTETETADQLGLLAVDEPELIERIHARSLGQPLFTEQLAAHLDDQAALPSLLADLLDRRLGDLDDESWAVVRLLGVAERPLRPALLSAATDLDAGRLTAQLRGLQARRLSRTAGGGAVELQHPLLAEAVRRRLVAGEDVTVHRTLATVLSDQDDAAPAEVAEHWQRAGEPGAELHWRVAAALEAAERLSWRTEWSHWRRALELWPDDSSVAGPPPGVTLVAAMTRAADATRAALDLEAVQPLAERLVDVAVQPDVGPEERAAALASAGTSLNLLGEDQRAAALFDECIQLCRDHGPPTQLVKVLSDRASIHADLGDHDAALGLAREAAAAAERLGDEDGLRRALSVLAWHEGGAGHHDRAHALMLEATEGPAAPSPRTELDVGMMLASLALQEDWPIVDVDRVAEVSLETVDRWQLDSFGAQLIRSNIALSYLAAGRLERALSVLADPPASEEYRQFVRARILLTQGQFDDAARALQGLRDLPRRVTVCLADVEATVAEMEIWNGNPGPARDRLEAVFGGDQDWASPPGWIADQLMLLARARADAVESARGPAEQRRRVAAELGDLLDRQPVDALGTRLPPTTGPAYRRTWAAELARIERAETPEVWAAAATAWDRAERPHHAAYCRWRAAQCALREGQGTVAARLLKRAAADAREHVPLLEAIQRTAQGR